MKILGLSLALLVSLPSCSSLGPPKDTSVETGGRSIRVKNSGAVIVSGRQVAKLQSSGKLVTGRGQLLAFLNSDSVRVKGGKLIPIRKGKDGSLYLSQAAQEKAGLKVVQARVTADGQLTRGDGKAGTPIAGDSDARTRRLLLVVLLIEENKMWPAGSQPKSSVGEMAGGGEEDGESVDENAGDESTGSQDSKDGDDLDWGDEE